MMSGFAPQPEHFLLRQEGRVGVYRAFAARQKPRFEGN